MLIYSSGLDKRSNRIYLANKILYSGVRDRNKNTIPHFTTESHVSESQQYSHIRTIPSSATRMNHDNPHRFPRPPTLPQSKIQIQAQREQKPAEYGPTFASMVGRTAGGHTSSFGAAVDGKEEASNPGSFTTSFDLLSIARMVPAKPKRLSNATGISETQVAELPTENLGIQGDWRKQVSSVAGPGGSIRSPPSESKSMVFRRAVAAQSSRLVRRSSGILTPDQTKSAQNHQQPAEGGDKSSSWKSEGVSPTKDRISSSTAPLSGSVPPLAGKGVNGCLETPESSQGELSQEVQPVSVLSYPDPSPKPTSLDPRSGDGSSNSCIQAHKQVDKEAEDHNRKTPKATLGRGGPVADASRMDPTAMFQPSRLVPATVDQATLNTTPSIGFTQASIHMTPVKNLNEGAGFLRAVAVPFEPKQPFSSAPATPSMIRHEEFTATSSNFPHNTRPQMETLAYLPDNFYGKTFNPSMANLLSPSLGSTLKLPPGEARQRPENIHVQGDQQAMKNSPSEFSIFGAPGDTPHKKLSFGDVGISRLWQASTEDGKTALGQPSLTSVNLTSFNPGAHLFLALKGNPGLVPPNKQHEQITVTKETNEPIVPIPRNTPNSHLLNVERLELKALALSKSEEDTISKVLLDEAAYIASVQEFIKSQATGENPLPELNQRFEDYLQKKIAKANPLPKVDKLGRRGAVSMQGTTRRGLESSDAHDGKSERLTLENQRKELMGEAEERKKWLKKWFEPNGEVEIRIRNEGDTSSGKNWLFPYPNYGESKEIVTTELALKAYEQLLSYLVPAEPDGIKSDKDYWRFDTRKSKSGYPPGKEPWYGGDHTSFFDMSFGVKPNSTIGKTAVKPPPGLSSTSIPRAQTVGPTKTDMEELGGLRDLVESSTPDYNDYGEEHRKVRAKTLQEWNSTPIRVHTPTNVLNGHVGTSRQGSNNSLPWTGNSGYEKVGQETNGSLRAPTVVVDRELSRSTILMQQSRPGSRFGVDMMGPMEGGSNLCPANGNGWEVGKEDTGAPIRDGNGSSEQGPRRRRPEQKKEAFGGIRKLGTLVFGSDDESGDE